VLLEGSGFTPPSKGKDPSVDGCEQRFDRADIGKQSLTAEQDFLPDQGETITLVIKKSRSSVMALKKLTCA